MTKVMIATPCFGGQVFVNYYMSMLRLMSNPPAGVSFTVRLRTGDSLVTRARNSLVAEFLADPTLTHLLWIDADIGFTPEAVTRLLDVDKDIASGVYPLKILSLPEELDGNRDELIAKHQRYPFNPVDPQTITVTAKGFVEVKDAPTGLMLIKREALEKMIEAYPHLKYHPDNQAGIDELQKRIGDCYYNFFDTFIDENGRYLSEDYAFCRLWQRLGGTVWVDAHSKLTHQGAHLYQGDFYTKLRALYPNPVAPQPVENPPVE